MNEHSTSRAGEVETVTIKALIGEAKLAERERRWSDAAVRYEGLVRNPLADDLDRLSHFLDRSGSFNDRGEGQDRKRYE